MTLKPGLGSLKVIENYKTKSGTHDFLLTFQVMFQVGKNRLFSSNLSVYCFSALTLLVGRQQWHPLQPVESC